MGGRCFRVNTKIAIETAQYHIMNKELRHPRRTPQWLRRSNSSPDNRATPEGTGNGAFTPRDNPKLTRPIHDSAAEEEPRLALSPMIDQTINVMKEHETQRHNLINTLIVVQLLITGAVAFGYHDRPGLIFPIMLASLGVYLVALTAGYVLKNDRLAAYMLVFGGGLAVSAQVVAATLTGNPEEIGHVALFFLAVMLEAGLLLTPEVTVIVVTAALALTAALLLLIALNKEVSGPQIYLVVLYTLSPMALTAIVSWLLSHFIYATTVTAQRAQDLEFRQAQFQQMKVHERERQQQLDQSIGSIQMAIAQAITGDYTVRVPISAGDLEVVENSLNLLLDTFDSMVQAQQENARMKGAVLPITEGLSRMSESSGAVPPIKTDTPFDNVSVMVTRIADNYNRRLTRLQEQLGRVSAGVAHSRSGLANASEEFAAAKRQAGALIAAADAVQASLQKQLELLVKTRRMLATQLPAEITQMGEQSAGGDPALRGLGIGVEPGLTREFEALTSMTPTPSNIPPLTAPLAAVNRDQVTHDAQSDTASSAESSASTTGAARALDGELPAELVEVWHLLLQIGEELNQQERTVATLTQDLGVLSRTVRNADTGIAWTLTALDTIQRSSDTAHQSSAQHPVPEGIEGIFPDGQDSGGFSVRRAGPSRPLWAGSTPESVDQPPPPGLLNAGDLLSGDAIGGLGSNALPSSDAATADGAQSDTSAGN